MTKVPEIPDSVRRRVKPRGTVIICCRGQKLNPDAIQALNEYMDMRKARAGKKRSGRSKS